MSTRSITLKSGYCSDKNEIPNRVVRIGGYSLQGINTSGINHIPFGIKRVLSPEIDIFSELPSFVFENEHAKLFLDEMKLALINMEIASLDGIMLSKLRVTEHTETTLVIEWIFNYFRLFFSFDAKEGDFFGEVSSDPENGRFHNDFNKMEISDFPKVAQEEVMFAVVLAGGEN